MKEYLAGFDLFNLKLLCPLLDLAVVHRLVLAEHGAVLEQSTLAQIEYDVLGVRTCLISEGPLEFPQPGGQSEP